MTATFFSWREKTSPDIESWKAKKFTYTWNGKSSNKAFWVFELESQYRPSKSIMNDRLLIAFVFGATDGDTVIKCDENRIYHEDADFLGEAKHPCQVIWKRNEVGAYGIGAMIRPFLTVSAIRLATRDEIQKTLGLSKAEAREIPNQAW